MKTMKTLAKKDKRILMQMLLLINSHSFVSLKV